MMEEEKKFPTTEMLKALEEWEHTPDEENEAFWNDLRERIKRHSLPFDLYVLGEDTGEQIKKPEA